MQKGKFWIEIFSNFSQYVSYCSRSALLFAGRGLLLNACSFFKILCAYLKPYCSCTICNGRIFQKSKMPPYYWALKLSCAIVNCCIPLLNCANGIGLFVSLRTCCFLGVRYLVNRHVLFRFLIWGMLLIGKLVHQPLLSLTFKLWKAIQINFQNFYQLCNNFLTLEEQKIVIYERIMGLNYLYTSSIIDSTWYKITLKTFLSCRRVQTLTTGNGPCRNCSAAVVKQGCASSSLVVLQTRHDQ